MVEEQQQFKNLLNRTNNRTLESLVKGRGLQLKNS